MKRWYDTQLGAPFFHAALVNRVDVQAFFAGTSALKIVPVLKTPAQAQFAGNSVANFNGLRLLPAIAQFAGASTFFGLLSGKLVPAIATFAGAGTALFAKPYLIQRCTVQFAGAGVLSANLTSFGTRQQAIVNFVGAGTFKADGTIKGRVQASASFVGASVMALTPRQRMAAAAKFAGASSWLIMPQLRMRAIANFIGTGAWQAMGNIIPAGGGIVPIAPILTLVSTTSDTTPDFSIDLPIGTSDGTEARVGDTLLIQDSADNGATWNTYVSHVLVSTDLSGASMSATSAPLASGSYLYRAQLFRGALLSAWSATISGAIFIPPLAPSFIVTSSLSDDTPDFLVTLPSGNGDDRDAKANDILDFQKSIDGGLNWSAYLLHTIISGDIPTFAISGPILAQGDYIVRARLERDVTFSSLWSENVSVRIGSVINFNMYLRMLANKPISSNPSTLSLRMAVASPATDRYLRPQSQKPDEVSMLSLRAQADKG